jgi:hypothetical protein
MSNSTVHRDTPASLAAQRLALVATVLEQLVLCEEFCVRCAEACLRTARPALLASCVEGTLECAETCAVAALQILRDPAITPELHLQICADRCAACDDLCRDEGGDHDFCRVCASICRQCRQSCENLTRITHGPIDRN